MTKQLKYTLYIKQCIKFTFLHVLNSYKINVHITTIIIQNTSFTWLFYTHDNLLKHSTNKYDSRNNSGNFLDTGDLLLQIFKSR